MQSPSPTDQPSRIKLAIVALLICAAIAFVLLPTPDNLPHTADPVATDDPVRTPSSAPLPKTEPAKPSGTPWREPTPRAGVDASNFYKDAFALFDQLSDEEKTMLRKAGEEVDADQAAQLFAKIQAIMALVREAAKADYCDWGLGPVNFDTPIPHLGKAQDLAKLALWAAAYRFPSDPSGAIADLRVRAHLGHHLADTLIGTLVASSFEKGAFKLLRDQLGSLDDTAMEEARQFTTASTIDENLSRAFAGEISGMESMIAKLGSQSVEERAKTLSLIHGPGEIAPETRATMDRMESLFRDPPALQAEVAYVRGVEEKAAAAMQLPEADFQSWWQKVQSGSPGLHPLADLAIPGIQPIQRAMQQARVERTLLSAGMAILQSGPAQLGQYRDPATGSALLYISTPTGFDLRATYEVYGKPVTLSFPTGK